MTTTHLQFKKGALFKVEKTIPLDNIQDLTFIENPFLNFFGLKILKIETAGNSAPNGADMSLIGIVGAAEFKNKVLRQRELLKAGFVERTFSDVKEETTESVVLLREIRDLLKELKVPDQL